MSDTHDRLLDHNYDGIQEFDNDLPRWWLWLFYITIVYGVLYFAYYHVFGIGYLAADEYRRELDPDYVRIQSRQAKFFGLVPVYYPPYVDAERDLAMAGQTKKRKLSGYVEETRESDTTTYVATSDPAALGSGKEIYIVKCTPCHGKFGEGNIGPNLTDDYWIHGAGMTNVTKTIKYGYPAKGMLAWRGDLSPEQILQVASYVLSLHGTNPPSPKAPQGELVKQ